MLPVWNSPLQNNLLANLPAPDFERLAANLELVEMPLGKVLYESGRRFTSVYFPTTAIVSIFHVLADGATSELAVVGNDGILGIAQVTGGETTPSRAVIQSAGWGYRLDVGSFKSEFNRGGALMQLLFRYTQALMMHMTQNAVCNRHHGIEQQLCRRLLLSLDRLNSETMTMTQDLIANILGVRREGVTTAAGKLQHKGLIRYSRGQITVLDRLGLENHACECYAVVKRESERLLPKLRPTTTMR